MDKERVGLESLICFSWADIMVYNDRKDDSNKRGQCWPLSGDRLFCLLPP
jgi:hypothetical protein